MRRVNFLTSAWSVHFQPRHVRNHLFQAFFANIHISVPQLICKMDPALFCQIFYSIGTAIDVGGPLISPFREYIMNYGFRSNTSTASGSSRQITFTTVLEYIGSFRVPHTWFTHYYLISVASSVFWVIQIFTQGMAFEFLASFSKPRSETMSVDQAFLAWLLMAIQGTRRLYECITFMKPTQSKMWAGTWIIGMAFYICMGISVWIEGIGLFPDPANVC
jgi:3-oxo-5-alpha-steroid 4-dehydrogenase 3